MRITIYKQHFISGKFDVQISTIEIPVNHLSEIRRRAGKHQRVEAAPDVVQDFSDDGGLSDEADDSYPLVATAEKRVGLVDAADEPIPRFSAGRKPALSGCGGSGGSSSGPAMVKISRLRATPRWALE